MGASVARLLPAYLATLEKYVALPSVATQGRAIPETAGFVRDLLAAEGFDAQILSKPEPGNPVVVGVLRGTSVEKIRAASLE